MKSTTEYVGNAIYEKRRRKAQERANRPIIIKKMVKPATSFPIRFVFYTFIIMVVLTFVTYNNSVVNELSYTAIELESKILAAEQENERLRLELDRKYDLTYIENVAKNELGLVKSTEVKKHYVKLSDGDKVIVSNRKKR